MNFDLIIKLIKLANNNPNDNEANLAARKVCTMLKDYKFIGVSTPRQKPYQRSPNEPQPVYTKPPFDPMKDIFGNKYWDQFFQQRAQENRWYNERPPTEAKIPEDYGSVEYEFTSPKDHPWVYDPLTGKKTRKNEERDLKCKTCHKTIKTKFVGLAEIFECNTCQWTAYEKSK